MGGLELGSLAEWVGAIGTVGALLVALTLWRRDEYFRRRTEIDKISMIYDVVSGTSDGQIVIVHDAEAGDFEITYTVYPRLGFASRYRRLKFIRRSRDLYRDFDQLSQTPVEDSMLYRRDHSKAIYEAPAPPYAYAGMYVILFRIVDPASRVWYFKLNRFWKFAPIGNVRGSLLYLLGYLKGINRPTSEKKEIPTHRAGSGR